MNVGKRYAVVNFFEDSTTGYWYAPYNKIYVLCEIDWGAAGDKNHYFFVRTKNDFILPRDFEIRWASTTEKDGNTEIRFLFDANWV